MQRPNPLLMSLPCCNRPFISTSNPTNSSSLRGAHGKMTERLLHFAHSDDAYKCLPAPGACNFLLELQRVIPFFQTSRLDQSHPTTLYLGDIFVDLLPCIFQRILRAFSNGVVSVWTLRNFLRRIKLFSAPKLIHPEAYRNYLSSTAGPAWRAPACPIAFAPCFCSLILLKGRTLYGSCTLHEDVFLSLNGADRRAR